MDQEIRNKLRNVVTQCRKLLENDTRDSLEGRFRIYEKKGEVVADPNAPMTHLEDATEVQARAEILDHFGHVKARGFKPKEALDQLVREIAFTHLNRLCAYKMMEAREVYVGGQKFREAVSRGVNSNGVKFYLADHPEDERLFNTGHQDIAYRHFLNWLGGFLSEDIGVLFNPDDPANRLYPRQNTLDEVLDLLNAGGIKPDETELRVAWPKIWTQDETIGWVYQYFTPKELRDAARDPKKGGSSAPRNSYELAFRNQFFTPRYVVEFLTDNTLGRIWYEMRNGHTKLKDQCRYMVRRQTEIFLKEGEHPPKDAAGSGDDLSQEELLKLPVHIPHRPKKDPRELKILDPACGSGHFLLYCFDLLLTIYEEAYADPDLGPSLRAEKECETLEGLRRQMPRMILAHNLHGIDIDLRASQIAALALWLRCQRAYQDTGPKKDRPKITRSNFVCAEPMPGEQQILKDFVAQLEPKLLGQLVEIVFEKMKLAGEAGSLLKIEEEIRETVASAKKQWIRETTKATDRKGQPLLFTQAAMDRLIGKPEQPSLFDLSDITDDLFFDVAEAQVVEALREYARKVQNGHQFQRRLFTDDAERGFAFVDLCHKRYDVVLMNPPFGSPTLEWRGDLCAAYPTSRSDLYAAFVTRAVHLLRSDGIVGAITNRTAFFTGGFTEWRHAHIYGNASEITLFADLGSGVLDSALVEVACYTLTAQQRSHGGCTSIGLLRDSDKSLSLLSECRSILSGAASARIFHTESDRFVALPNQPFAYWVTNELLKLFNTSEKMEPLELYARLGLRTLDDFRFLRLWVEIPSGFQETREWVFCLKGGPYRRYYGPPHLVCLWRDDGRELKSLASSRYGSKSRTIQAQDFYFRRGLTYSRRTTSRLGVRVAPAECNFSDKGPLIVGAPDSEEHLYYLLGLLNTDVVEYMIALGLAAGEGAARSYEVGLIQRLPRIKPTDSERTAISRNCRRIVALLWQLDLFDTMSPYGGFWCNDSDSIAELTNRLNQKRTGAVSEIEALQSHNELIIRQTIGIATEDPYITAFFSANSENEFSSEEEDDADSGAGSGFPDSWEPKRLASGLLEMATNIVMGRCGVPNVLQERNLTDAPDFFSPCLIASSRFVAATTSGSPIPAHHVHGILVDDREHQDDIVRRIRDVLELIWKDRADAIEKEACELLGVQELKEYFRKPGKTGFWDDHISRYSKSRRKAPIYWLIQSSKRNYALWLDYHRLDKDLLFKALVNYVEPKIRLESSRLDTFRNQKAAATGNSAKEAKRSSKEVERQEDLISELRDFEDKLRRAANLHLEPDLNDGVVLNIAPLHELVPWKKAKEYWEELLEGKYEWSSIGKQLRQNGLVK
jgi:hypothetical protein